MNNIITYSSIFLLALIIGSFLNVVIYRLPLMLQRSWRQQCLAFLNLPSEPQPRFNLAWPSSHCPHCQHKIHYWQNIPILSFILQKAKCSHCHAPISWRYPIVELTSALLAILCFYYWGWSAQTLAAWIFTASMLTLFFIDLQHQILPDEITLPILWLGLLISLSPLFVTPVMAILGAALGYLILWLVGLIFKLIRKIEGIGQGDYKLLACFGAWLGWHPLPFILLLASILGLTIGLTLIWRKKASLQTAIAFGPYLILAGMIAFFLQPYWS